ncbi:exosortase/archaeosortase family protein [bacterium]|nr:exosortase/archaeosortase family protein [bacterium]
MHPVSNQTASRRIPAIAWVVTAAVVVLLGIAFRQPIERMVGIWQQKDSYYSHGWLVPLVALYLVWRRRAEFVEQPRASWLGLAMMLAGILILVVSGWLVVFFTAGFGLILTIWGLCGFLFGWPTLKRLTFPAFVLCFMVPPPEQMIASISLKMKMLATALAIRVIDAAGIVAVNDGQTIYLGNAYVTVGDACSGLRSLISLIFLGVLFAYFSNLSRPRKAILALSSVPIAILSNVVRIVTISLVAYFLGTKAVPPVHDASGYLIFIVAFFMLYGTMWLLGRGRRPAAGHAGEQAP